MNQDENLRYLRDQSDIKDVIHRFVSEADKRSVEGMARCVSDDAVISYNDGAVVTRGISELRTYMTNQFAPDGTLNPETRGTHAMCNSIVTLDGDRAMAETSGVTYLATPAGKLYVRGVRYADRFSRIDGVWKLVERLHSCGWQMDATAQVSPPNLNVPPEPA